MNTTPHLLRSTYGQCRCFWCGRRVGYCSVTPDIRRAIHAFASTHGRTWKDTLTRMWSDHPEALVEELIQARNIIGPTGIYRITPRVLRSVERLHDQQANSAEKGGA